MPSEQNAARDRAPNHLFPFGSFAAVVAITWITVGILVTHLRDSNATIEAFDEQLQVAWACGEVAHFDEVLTMSARMCAATGDLEWERRYAEHLRLLDGAIARARAYARYTRYTRKADSVLGTVQMAAANERLIELERQAFDDVRAGRRAEAWALLTGENYVALKESYSAGMERDIESLRAHAARVKSEANARVQFDKSVLLASLPLLALLWFALARTVRAHIRRRNESEKQLRVYTSDLEARNEQVRAADRAKSEFLAKMSHEIRTPMNGVLGVAELLTDTELDEDQRGLVGIIHSSGKSLLSVIDDILDFSKLEAGKLRIETLPFDPLPIAHEVLEMVRAGATTRDTKLVCRVGREPAPHVCADPLRLRQILINLVGNAIKFTSEGMVEVGFRRTETGDRLAIDVRDTGIGIASADLETVFERFEQARGTTHAYGGTGLGLAISRELARLMGGDLVASSVEGAGSVFTLTIPLALEASRVNAAFDAISAPLPRASTRVLVVEDNAVNQIIARRMIEKLGCRVDIACDGVECIDALRRSAYDLIFMDCHLPHMDGLEATRVIRAGEDASTHVPIVALTASAFPGDIEACRDAGMDDFLSKPFTAASLTRVLVRWTGAEDALAEVR